MAYVYVQCVLLFLVLAVNSDQFQILREYTLLLKAASSKNRTGHVLSNNGYVYVQLHLHVTILVLAVNSHQFQNIMRLHALI